MHLKYNAHLKKYPIILLYLFLLRIIKYYNFAHAVSTNDTNKKIIRIIDYKLLINANE